MSIADHIDDIREWTARNQVTRLRYWAEQDNPHAPPRCRACGSDLTLFRTCPCKEPR